MKLSHVPIGVRFIYKDVEYVKSNHNRGMFIVNRQKNYKQLRKHIEVCSDDDYFKA